MKWADLTATNGQFSRPPVGSYVTAYEHFSMAADKKASDPRRLLPGVALTVVRLFVLDRYGGAQGCGGAGRC